MMKSYEITEAWKDIEIPKGTPMVFTKDGEIVPARATYFVGKDDNGEYIQFFSPMPSF